MNKNHKKKKQIMIQKEDDYDFENDPQFCTNKFVMKYVNFFCSSDLKDSKQLLLTFLNFINPAFNEDLTRVEGNKFKEKILIYTNGITLPSEMIENLTEAGGCNGILEQLIMYHAFRHLNERNHRLSHEETFYSCLNEFLEKPISDMSQLSVIYKAFST